MDAPLPVAQRAAVLLRLWSELSVQHIALGGTCGCGAGGVSLRLEDFELDIFDFLRDAAERSGIASAVALFAAWDAEEGPDQPLRRLMERMEQGRVDEQAAAFLCPKLERSLRSFAELHGSRADD